MIMSEAIYDFNDLKKIGIGDETIAKIRQEVEPMAFGKGGKFWFDGKDLLAWVRNNKPSLLAQKKRVGGHHKSEPAKQER